MLAPFVFGDFDAQAGELWLGRRSFRRSEEWTSRPAKARFDGEFVDVWKVLIGSYGYSPPRILSESFPFSQSDLIRVI